MNTSSPNPNGRPVTQPCGTRAAYKRGCRCTACKAAQADYYSVYARGKREERRRQQAAATGRPSLDWMDDATCRHLRLPTHLFFIGRNEKLDPRVRAACAACPVRAQCLDYALREHITHGYWGGTTEEQRRQLRRERRAS